MSRRAAIRCCSDRPAPARRRCCRSSAASLHPSEGSVFIRGNDFTDMPPARRPTATVFQDYALFPHFSVGNNVGFGLQDARRPARQTHRAGARGAGDGGPGRCLQQDAAPAFRRTAAARGAGARAGRRAGGASARRAARRARPEAAPPDAGRAEGAAEARRHRLHPRHARPGGGDGAGRPLRGDEPWPDRGPGAAGARLFAAGLAASAPPSWANRRCCRARCRISAWTRSGSTRRSARSRSRRPASRASTCRWRSARNTSRSSRRRASVSLGEAKVVDVVFQGSFKRVLGRLDQEPRRDLHRKGPLEPAGRGRRHRRAARRAGRHDPSVALMPVS